MRQGHGDAGHFHAQVRGFSFPGQRYGHITGKELVPIVMAWGKGWQGKTVQFWCDNAAVVCIVNSGRSKEQHCMHLMRCLSFFLAHFNVFIFAEHLPGRQNQAADSLSRDDVASFRAQVLGALKVPTQIPVELTQALTWRTLFTSILRKV